MKDLFNDPKEKFKLKRTSIAREPKRKNRKQNKDKQKRPQTLTTRSMTQEYLNLGKGVVHARSTTRGWQSELEQLRENNSVKYPRSVLQQERRTFNTTGGNDSFILSQNALSKTRIAKLIQQLWDAVHHVKKVNNYYVTGADFLKVFASLR